MVIAADAGGEAVLHGALRTPVKAGEALLAVPEPLRTAFVHFYIGDRTDFGAQPETGINIFSKDWKFLARPDGTI